MKQHPVHKMLGKTRWSIVKWNTAPMFAASILADFGASWNMQTYLFDVK